MLEAESEEESAQRREREATELFAAAQRELGEEKMSRFAQLLISSVPSTTEGLTLVTIA
jgi:hypothetical protein